MCALKRNGKTFAQFLFLFCAKCFVRTTSRPHLCTPVESRVAAQPHRNAATDSHISPPSASLPRSASLHATSRRAMSSVMILILCGSGYLLLLSKVHAEVYGTYNTFDHLGGYMQR